MAADATLDVDATNCGHALIISGGRRNLSGERLPIKHRDWFQ
jgi:hypothetical protein